MKYLKICETAHKKMIGNTSQPGRETGYIYYHGRRVAGLCHWLALELKAKRLNMHNLQVAAMFHDIAKGKKHHALAGAKMLPQVLKGLCSKAELDNICRLVSEHNLREKPNRCQTDAKILQDADTLDHFGAQGVWLSCSISSRNPAAQESLFDYFKSKENDDYESRSKSLLNFEVSRKELTRRLKQQKQFIKNLHEENMEGYLLQS